MHGIKKVGLSIFAIAASFFAYPVVVAQDYPTKPVTITVAFPAGGGTDIVARKVAQSLSAKWNQSVVIDNKPGAAGVIGTTATARAEPNGYQIMLATLGNMAINQHLYKMDVNPAKDLAPITNVVGVTFVLVAHPSLPANNVQELIALAKQSPGKLNYSSSGSGGAPHLATELFMSMTGTKFTHIPYKGSGPSFTDLIGGQVNFTMDSLVQSLPYIQSGKLKVLAVLGSKRSDVLPDVPTIAESGVPGYDFTNWFGFVAPAKTPVAILDKLNKDIVEVLSQSSLKEDFKKMGAEVIGNSREDFSKQISSSTDIWGKIIKQSNIQAQ